MTKLDTLLQWHRAGYVTLVPWQNRKAAHRRPLITGWHDARPSEETIVKWHQQWPLADWAYRPTGGVVVLDLEMKKGLNGVHEIAVLCQTHSRCMVSTMTMRSYSGGFHWYFRSRQPIVGGWSLVPGVEIKAENGSVHIPASEGYSLLTPLVPMADLPYLPEWLESLIQSAQSTKKNSSSYQSPRYAEGSRRQHLCSMAGAFRNLGLTGSELRACLRAMRDSRCEGDFPDAEVDAIADDYATKAVGTVGLALLGDPLATSVMQFCESRRAK